MFLLWGLPLCQLYLFLTSARFVCLMYVLPGWPNQQWSKENMRFSLQGSGLTGVWGGRGKCWAVTWVHSEDDTSVQQTPNMAGDGQMRPLFTKNEKVWWRPFNLKSWIMALHGHIWELVELTGTWFTFKYGSYFCRSANSLRDCQSGLIMGRNSVFNRITGLYFHYKWVG